MNTKPKFVDDVEYKNSVNVQSGKEWNWVNPARGSFDFPANYYESSLQEWQAFDALNADVECDVVVIGGGLLGTSTALHLAEQGVDTVLVEKNRIGSAASGRNGGQLTPGLARWEAGEMIEHFSYEDAKRLWHFTSTEAMSLIDQIAQNYDLDLQRKHQHITAAVHPGHLVGLTEGADARKYLGEDHTQIMGKNELFEHVKSENYYGGLLDTLGGHIHPLALNRGLAYGFSQQGGKIYEQTEVLSVDEREDGIYVTTTGGVIKARKSAVIGVHHASFKLLQSHNQTTIPFYTYVCTTAPLELDLAEILPSDAPVYDTQFQIDYYRGVSKNRLLFGGEGTGSCWAPEKTHDYLLSRIKHVFPQLTQVELDFVWSGTTDLTMNGAADSRKSDGKYPIYAVQGWSGHGVAQTVRIGKAIADDFCGNADDFKMLTSIQHQDILFGRALAPMVIPMAKTAYGLGAMVNPGKMVSF
ncbi:FAD-binding oxidoreductase [Acinetobacter sp. YH12029]|uniref:NAD(P)/FAD-dependent oxidoreductase n=1 Tax=Acinetobacter sp. YH12029 TaxID=2601044 RepID=UPI0015D3C542|nr:FAD-dependent oxidoreductase [Acinetobacter sp. YH12029]